MMLHIALVFNKKKRRPEGAPDDHYAEFDKKDTILAIQKALESRGNRVTPIEADECFYDNLAETRPDIVYNIAEGLRGEMRESYVPLVCENLHTPYTGSGPLALGLCLDKARTKEILAYYRIPTAKFQVFKSPAEKLSEELEFPLIVKPVAEGSSKGIRPDSVVNNDEALADKIARVNSVYNEPAIVEQFLPGREFTVSVLGNSKPYTLPLIEIYLEKYRKSNRVYSYEAKTKWEEDSRSGKPVHMDMDMEKKLLELAIKAHKVLDCKDLSRVDIRLDENERPHVLEVNPLPGLNPSIEDVSYMPKAARMAGISYEDLINTVLANALKRYGMIKDGIECRVDV